MAHDTVGVASQDVLGPTPVWVLARDGSARQGFELNNDHDAMRVSGLIAAVYRFIREDGEHPCYSIRLFSDEQLVDTLAWLAHGIDKALRDRGVPRMLDEAMTGTLLEVIKTEIVGRIAAADPDNPF